MPRRLGMTKRRVASCSAGWRRCAGTSASLVAAVVAVAALLVLPTPARSSPLSLDDGFARPQPADLEDLWLSATDSDERDEAGKPGPRGALRGGLVMCRLELFHLPGGLGAHAGTTPRLPLRVRVGSTAAALDAPLTDSALHFVLGPLDLREEQPLRVELGLRAEGKQRPPPPLALEARFAGRWPVEVQTATAQLTCRGYAGDDVAARGARARATFADALTALRQVLPDVREPESGLGGFDTERPLALLRETAVFLGPRHADIAAGRKSLLDAERAFMALRRQAVRDAAEKLRATTDAPVVVTTTTGLHVALPVGACAGREPAFGCSFSVSVHNTGKSAQDLEAVLARMDVVLDDGSDADVAWLDAPTPLPADVRARLRPDQWPTALGPGGKRTLKVRALAAAHHGQGARALMLRVDGALLLLPG